MCDLTPAFIATFCWEEVEEKDQEEERGFQAGAPQGHTCYPGVMKK